MYLFFIPNHLRWQDLKILKMDVFVKFHYVRRFGLCVEPLLCSGGFTNKERRTALTQRETNHKQPKATGRFGGSLNDNHGRSRHKQSCSFCVLLENVVCSFVVFCPFQNILGSSLACSSPPSARWPLWSYTGFHEVLERERGCKLIPPPVNKVSKWATAHVVMSKQDRGGVISWIIHLTLTCKGEFMTPPHFTHTELRRVLQEDYLLNVFYKTSASSDSKSGKYQ